MKFTKVFAPKTKSATKNDEPKVKRSVKQKALSIVGWVMIAGGLASVSVFVYENFIDNLIQGPRQQQEAKTLYDQWGNPLPTSSASATAKPRLTEGYPVLKGGFAEARKFGILRIPALGKKFVHTIAEGTRQATVLNVIGVGHYRSSQMPGEAGNFAVAGHRTSHGAPFMDLDKLKKGDEIFVDTKLGTYVYSVIKQEVVDPTDVWVIAPARGLKNSKKTDKWMTMTTCTPKYSAEHRLVVWSKFEYFEPR